MKRQEDGGGEQDPEYNPEVVRELRTYVTNWGIKRHHTPLQLLHSYLACSVPFSDNDGEALWKAVYTIVIGHHLRLDKHVYGAHLAGGALGGSVEPTFARRKRNAIVHAALLDGAQFGGDAKSTSLYAEFMTSVPCIEHLMPCQHVMLFHLVGIPNLRIMLSAPELCLDDYLRPYDRYGIDKIYGGLVALGDQWKRYPPSVKEMSLLITNCEYPALDKIQWEHVSPPSLHSTNDYSLDKRNDETSVSRTRENVKRAPVTFPAHTPLKWDTVTVERSFADNEQLRQYKAHLRVPMYYPSKATLGRYLREAIGSDKSSAPFARESFSALECKELLQLCADIANVASPDSILKTSQGKDFAATLAGCTGQRQLSHMTTHDVLLRLLFVHHPKWAQYYADTWSLPRGVSSEIDAHLKRFPRLSDELLNTIC